MNIYHTLPYGAEQLQTLARKVILEKYYTKIMKKQFLALISLVFIITGCTSNSGGSGVTPTDVVLSPTIADGGQVLVPRPDLPVVAIYRTSNFLLELFYANNQFTYYGTIQMPTPCHTIDVTVAVRESFPETVVMSFKTVQPEEQCTQVVSQKHISGTVAVSAGANFDITLDNVAVPKFVN